MYLTAPQGNSCIWHTQTRNVPIRDVLVLAVTPGWVGGETRVRRTVPVCWLFPNGHSTTGPALNTPGVYAGLPQYALSSYCAENLTFLFVLVQKRSRFHHRNGLVLTRLSGEPKAQRARTREIGRSTLVEGTLRNSTRVLRPQSPNQNHCIRYVRSRVPPVVLSA